MENKLLVICGPTATGKTKLAVELAGQFSGEIVSADSRQVYRYMDIGTGKDLPVNSKFETLNPKQITNYKLQITNHRIGYYKIDGIKVWLYDVVEPDYQFNVADYVECANLVIKDIWKREKLPILVGGTGFYLKAVVDGIETIGIKPDWELRKQLSKLAIEQLREKLKDIDPERMRGMNESDRNNPRRLIRAIEVATKSQSAKCKVQSAKLRISDLFIIGLTTENKILYERIDKRVEERVAQGVEEEIKQLLKRGYSFDNSVLGTTIGYKEWGPLRDAKMQRSKDTKREIIQKWKFAEHGYARRQMTWFKKVHNIHWFDIMESDYQQKIARLIKEWYH